VIVTVDYRLALMPRSMLWPTTRRRSRSYPRAFLRSGASLKAQFLNMSRRFEELDKAGLPLGDRIADPFPGPETTAIAHDEMRRLAGVAWSALERRVLPYLVDGRRMQRRRRDGHRRPSGRQHVPEDPSEGSSRAGDRLRPRVRWPVAADPRSNVSVDT
jgi:hypothetical protein